MLYYKNILFLFFGNNIILNEKLKLSLLFDEYKNFIKYMQMNFLNINKLVLII